MAIGEKTLIAIGMVAEILVLICFVVLFFSIECKRGQFVYGTAPKLGKEYNCTGLYNGEKSENRPPDWLYATRAMHGSSVGFTLIAIIMWGLALGKVLNTPRNIAVLIVCSCVCLTGLAFVVLVSAFMKLRLKSIFAASLAAHFMSLLSLVMAILFYLSCFQKGSPPKTLK